MVLRLAWEVMHKHLGCHVNAARLRCRASQPSALLSNVSVAPAGRRPNPKEVWYNEVPRIHVDRTSRRDRNYRDSRRDPVPGLCPGPGESPPGNMPIEPQAAWHRYDDVRSGL